MSHKHHNVTPDGIIIRSYGDDGHRLGIRYSFPEAGTELVFRQRDNHIVVTHSKRVPGFRLQADGGEALVDLLKIPYGNAIGINSEGCEFTFKDSHLRSNDVSVRPSHEYVVVNHRRITETENGGQTEIHSLKIDIATGVVTSEAWGCYPYGHEKDPKIGSGKDVERILRGFSTGEQIDDSRNFFGAKRRARFHDPLWTPSKRDTALTL